MRSFAEVTAALRRKNIGQYGLLGGCCFFSVLLITAYVTMMQSPTVVNVLPVGGDSRKQVMMIFVLAIIGCGIFTIYASGLFFRYKSREVGTFLALGATKSSLRGILSRELLLVAALSCALGTALGVPLAWGIWQGFRLAVVDSAEMAFVFAPQALLFALAFSVFVFGMLFVMLGRFLRRTNIVDVLNDARKSETVRLVPRYFGWLGILLIVGGCFLGYQMPSVFILGMQWYPPEGLTAIFYLPALAGLYMVLLHTVVNGWRHKKSRYKGIIGTSMMRFQGRQTVRNLLVVSVLVAGAFFAAFYSPMLMTGMGSGYDTWKLDYFFNYRADQPLPSEQEIRTLAQEMDVSITGYASAPGALLAIDGEDHVEIEGPLGTTYDKIYRKQWQSSIFLSESGYNALTGEQLDVAPGTVAAIFTDDGQDLGMTSNELSLVTNMVTGEEFPLTPRAEVLCDNQLFGRRVLDDGDFARISADLTDEWRETLVGFNVADVEASYLFSKALYYQIIDRSGPEVEITDAWDPVVKRQAELDGKAYWADPENIAANGFSPVSYDQPDSTEFRLYWMYMPQFRILDTTELVKTMAVYLMLFVFIAIICFAAAMVILFTRSMTIAMTNQQIYTDLGKLGASKAYLYGTVKSQVSHLFVAPICTGTLLISLFYSMILFFNDNAFSPSEQLSAVTCLLIIAAMLAVFYGLYRLTLTRVCRALGLK